MTTFTKPHRIDRWIPWFFVLFFVVIAIVNAVFVYLATSTQTGVVTENAYQKGLNYNATLDQAAAAEALGWRGSVALSPEHELHFTLHNENGAPIHGAAVTAWFVRPTAAGHDFSVTLNAGDAGTYHQAIAFPLEGVWDVTFVATWNAQQWQKHQRLVVQ